MSEDPYKESKARSAIKGISWRFVATATIIIIVYFKTGEVTQALEIGAIEFVFKFALYYVHERLWAQVPRGSIRKMISRKKNAN